MNPEVPRWARDIIAREVPSAEFSTFHVLKDSLVQKLAVGVTAANEAFIIQRTPTGGELYRVASRDPRVPPRSVEATCGDCGTTFVYALDGPGLDVHCFACGARLAHDAPLAPPPPAAATPPPSREAAAEARR